MDLSKLNNIPTCTGVYKFLDENKKILYIGKANNLENRVSSYFNNDLLDRPFVKQMIPFIHVIEVVKTNNEIESLVLESALIKKHKPKYNTDLKDDKSYVWIYIPVKDDFPTVKIVRKISSEDLKRGEIFGPYPKGSTVKRIFTYLRKLYPFCTCKKESSKECLYYHLGLCPAPYQGHISKEDYRKNINEIIKFLKGRKRGHLKQLEKEMNKYSLNKEYEKATVIRDKLTDLKYLGEKIEFEYGDNEETYVERRKKTLMSNFHDLRIELGLKSLTRIECYDISNTQGTLPYASMSVAENGELKNSEYRIFKIQNLNTPNDPEMLKEAITRRLLHREKYSNDPEIILIDGGKSQLSVLSNIVPKDILLLGISKGKRIKRKGKRLLDEFWITDKDSNKILPIKIKNKNILIALRDEAHRFAILHHRKARIREGKRSVLENISGVGRKQRMKLLKHFKNIEKIKKATFKEIDSVVKNKTTSANIVKYFNTTKNLEE